MLVHPSTPTDHGVAFGISQLAVIEFDRQRRRPCGITLAATVARPLTEGRFGDYETPLRYALQAGSAPLRAQVDMSGPVWLELTKDVRALLAPRASADGATVQPAASVVAAQLSPADHQSVGEFWYSVAAGEWAVDRSQLG